MRTVTIGERPGSGDWRGGSMRKVVAYVLVSVDGVAEDPETFLLEFDEVMEANLAEVISTQDTVLLGRKMYDQWSDHWPRSDDHTVCSGPTARVAS